MKVISGVSAVALIMSFASAQKVRRGTVVGVERSDRLNNYSAAEGRDSWQK
jgi:hypothetical protein